MLTEHKYAQVWRWIADGKDVQFFSTLDKAWEPLAENTVVLCNAYLGVEFQFRLKPRTVKIGSREVEAPVLEFSRDQPLWTYNADGTPKNLLPYVESYVRAAVKGGRAFQSADAALAAYEATAALLRGEA